jgi:hypothetical protein
VNYAVKNLVFIHNPRFDRMQQHQLVLRFIILSKELPGEEGSFFQRAGRRCMAYGEQHWLTAFLATRPTIISFSNRLI